MLGSPFSVAGRTPPQKNRAGCVRVASDLGHWFLGSTPANASASSCSLCTPRGRRRFLAVGLAATDDPQLAVPLPSAHLLLGAPLDGAGVASVVREHQVAEVAVAEGLRDDLPSLRPSSSIQAPKTWRRPCSETTGAPSSVPGLAFWSRARGGRGAEDSRRARMGMRGAPPEQRPAGGGQASQEGRQAAPSTAKGNVRVLSAPRSSACAFRRLRSRFPPATGLPLAMLRPKLASRVRVEQLARIEPVLRLRASKHGRELASELRHARAPRVPQRGPVRHLREAEELFDAAVAVRRDDKHPPRQLSARRLWQP